MRTVCIKNENIANNPTKTGILGTKRFCWFSLKISSNIFKITKCNLVYDLFTAFRELKASAIHPAVMETYMSKSAEFIFSGPLTAV